MAVAAGPVRLVNEGSAGPRCWLPPGAVREYGSALPVFGEAEFKQAKLGTARESRWRVRKGPQDEDAAGWIERRRGLREPETLDVRLPAVEKQSQGPGRRWNCVLMATAIGGRGGLDGSVAARKATDQYLGHRPGWVRPARVKRGRRRQSYALAHAAASAR